MRKLQMKMSMSLDGFVSGPGGSLDWIFKTGDEQSKAMALEQCSAAGLIIMGRKSFEGTASYWPTSTDAFARPMNEIPKAVFTKNGYKGYDPGPDPSPAALSWANARIFEGDLVQGINELKAEEGKPISAIGGAEFMRSLIAARLIDEFYLFIHPVALGSGLRIFDGIEDPLYLNLVDVKVFPKGTTLHIYKL
ncbi:dihydrofolate reductase [Chitinophaga silvatica]|uniref:Dihydrofolate reductase n=1 Tax=Chitinophaga silvatica TaxID=2282649 RepID=A0A3E1Y935_9BACT|nr:dihydrofolate reductase family protein [Chitinophaga silvatica]RFS21861.1 dihydrofolate reductase [Chitinophaga silvatica]